MTDPDTRLGAKRSHIDPDIRLGGNLKCFPASHVHFFVGGKTVYNQTGWGPWPEVSFVSAAGEFRVLNNGKQCRNYYVLVDYYFCFRVNEHLDTRRPNNRRQLCDWCFLSTAASCAVDSVHWASKTS